MKVKVKPLPSRAAQLTNHIGWGHTKRALAEVVDIGEAAPGRARVVVVLVGLKAAAGHVDEDAYRNVIEGTFA